MKPINIAPKERFYFKKMSKTSRKLLIFILLACLSLVVSACLKTPQVNINQTVNVNQNTNAEPYDSLNTFWEIDEENWKTFVNEKYGYQIDIPPCWDVRFSLDSEGNIMDYKQICVGSCEGRKIYSLIINISENPDKYSSKEFIHWGEGYYDKEFEVIVGDSYKAYEFYGVWAGDQGEEVIFLTKDDIAIQFSFPIARENPNLDNPIENNQLVHQALETFRFIEQ